MAHRDFEAQYQALFDYAPDGILIADAQSNYLDANLAMCRMLGYERAELIGKHATDIVVPEEIEHIDPALRTIKAKAGYSREGHHCAPSVRACDPRSRSSAAHRQPRRALGRVERGPRDRRDQMVG
jgi:PAS domain-containing protein